VSEAVRNKTKICLARRDGVCLEKLATVGLLFPLFISNYSTLGYTKKTLCATTEADDFRLANSPKAPFEISNPTPFLSIHSALLFASFRLSPNKHNTGNALPNLLVVWPTIKLHHEAEIRALHYMEGFALRVVETQMDFHSFLSREIE